MKTPSHELHALIQAMTRSEKRYFNLFTRRHKDGPNNYLKLFEIIDKQGIYDEERVKSGLKGEKFVDHLAVVKNQLFDLILESLHHYENQRNEHEKLKYTNHAIHILLDKKRYKAASKEIKKVKQEARNREDFTVLLEVLQLEKQLLTKMYYEPKQEGQIRSIYHAENKCLEQVKNLNEYWQIGSEVARLHYKKVTPREDAHRKILAELTSHPLLEDPSRASSFAARMEYYRINANLCFIREEFQQAHSYNHRLLAEMEKQPEKLTQYRERYISLLNNYLIDSLNLKKFEAFEEGIRKLGLLSRQKEFQKLKDFGLRLFNIRFTLQLNRFIATAEFEAGLRYLNSALPELSRWEHKLPKHQLVTYHYLISYIYFANNEFENALEWIIRNTQETREEIVEEIYGYSRLLNILIHFELNNVQLVDHLIQSTQRYYKRRYTFIPVEKVILRYLKKLIYEPSRSSELGLWKNMRKELIKLKQKDSPQTAFKYFNYLAWADAKILGESFRESARKEIKEEL